MSSGHHKPPRRRAPALRFLPKRRCSGGVGEWLNPSDCKSDRLAYTGSNPVPSTIALPSIAQTPAFRAPPPGHVTQFVTQFRRRRSGWLWKFSDGDALHRDRNSRLQLGGTQNKPCARNWRWLACQLCAPSAVIQGALAVSGVAGSITNSDNGVMSRQSATRPIPAVR